MYIVLGARGYIGSAIVNELKSRTLSYGALCRERVDYTSSTIFGQYLDKTLKQGIKDLTIINCAGYVGKPNVDACEENKEDCILGNVLFPSMLSNLCASRGVKLCHISSGCIYNGYEKDFSEEDVPNFTMNKGSFYSGTKALAERILKNKPLTYIFRLRIPFDHIPSPRNYITKLIDYKRLLNRRNSLSHRGDFAHYSLNLLEMKAPYGIYNITNKGHLNTSEITALIQESLLPNKQFHFFEKYRHFLKITTAPRSNCILDTSKLESYMPVRSAQDSMEDALSKYIMR